MDTVVTQMSWVAIVIYCAVCKRLHKLRCLANICMLCKDETYTNSTYHIQNSITNYIHLHSLYRGWWSITQMILWWTAPSNYSNITSFDHCRIIRPNRHNHRPIHNIIKSLIWQESRDKNGCTHINNLIVFSYTSIGRMRCSTYSIQKFINSFVRCLERRQFLSNHPMCILFTQHIRSRYPWQHALDYNISTTHGTIEWCISHPHTNIDCHCARIIDQMTMTDTRYHASLTRSFTSSLIQNCCPHVCIVHCEEGM